MPKFSSSIVLTAAMLLVGPRLVAGGELRLSIANGRVTLVAQDVSVRQILDEWARIGQTRIVNADKLSGPPVTLELTDVPEAKALDTVLRSVAGYVLAARASGTGPSVYDRIMILPTSRAPAVTATAPATAFRQPTPQPQPQPMPAMPAVDDDDETRAVEGILPPGMVPPPGSMQPGATPFPVQGQPAPPGMQPAPGIPPVPGQPAQPGQAPMTAPRPGMLPAPAVPGNPYQPPPVPVRPPGGPGDAL